MTDVMHLRERCPALWNKGIFFRCVCFVVLSAAGCTFDPSGTGEARSRRTQTGQSVNAAPLADDVAEAARIAADRLRNLAPAAESGGAAGRPESSAVDRDRASEADSAAVANAGAASPAGVSAAALSGGAAGAAAQPETTVVERTGGAAAEAGMPHTDEADAGDEDSGAAPGMQSGRDRELLLSLLEISVGVLRADPNAQPGDLLATLGAATSVGPALLARVLTFVQGAQNCDQRAEACKQLCDVVATRCSECTANAGCRTALSSTCGSSATECR
jgi:hypothetical protein